VINIQQLKDFKHDLERHDLYFKEQNENVAILNKSNKKLIDNIKVFLNKIKISKSLLKTHRIHVDELKQLVIKFNSKTKEKINQDIQRNKKKYEHYFNEISDLIDRIDVNIEKFFDNVFKTISGVYFGIIGLIIFTLSTVLSVVIYLSIDPNYSIYTNWISDLGIGPGGAKWIFNIGWMISSLILLFFHTFEIRELKNKGVKNNIIKFMVIFSISLSSGIFLVGFVPLDRGFSHTIAALIYFIGGFGFFSLYGIIILMISRMSKIYSIIAFITALSYILYFLSPVIVPFTSSFGITITFLEWFTLFTELSMMLVILSNSINEHYLRRRIQREKLKMINIKNLILFAEKFIKKMKNN